jgi:hypothetical protein
MDFPFDNFNQFSVQHTSPSCRTPVPTNYPPNFYPHKPNLRAEFNDLRDKFYQIKAARFTSTHFSHTYTPHKTCSYCSNPYHSNNNCPSWGQFSNFSYEQMNTSFSNSGCDSNFNFQLGLPEIMLINLMKCTIQTIHSSITKLNHLLIKCHGLHLHLSLHWKTYSMHSCSQPAKTCKS